MNNYHASSIQSGMYRVLSAFMILSMLLGAVGIPTGVVHAAPVDVSLEATADTWLRQSQATMNYGSMTIIQTSPNSSSRQNSLYLWDLSSIPTGSTVTTASITFYVTDVSAYDFNLYQMRRNWVEGTNNGAAGTGASWTYSEAGTDTWASAGAMSTTTDRYDVDLWGATGSTFNTLGSVTVPLNASGVAAIQSWITTPASNFGLTMQYMGSGTTADYLYVAARDNPSYAGATLNITYETAGPIITTTGILTAFSATPGVDSTEQSYSVSGSSLTDDIVITAPADFQISTTSGSGFGSSLTLIPTGGTVASTTIYVRFNRATEGISNGTITHFSTGATTQNVAVSGTATAAGTITFAAFGDYGSNSSNEQAVATLVSEWNPDFIITTGDNSYGSTAIDENIGKYYSNFIGNYVGSYGSGAVTNNFYPSLGNHDYTDGGGSTAYFNYFTLPNNERYFDFVRGPVHFFVIDSNPVGTGSAPGDGRSPSSAQGTWLQAGLAASTSPWKIVYMHHPPFSSGSTHGSETVMQWPYEAWGATAVLSGHDHTYERVMRDDNSNGVNLPYFVTGAGGMSLYSFVTPVTGSAVRYSSNYGSMKVQANATNITFEFWSVAGGGTLIDTYTINNSTSTITTTGTLNAFASQPGVDSAEQSYSVAGSNLTGDLVITAPADFTISTTSGNGFGSSVTLTPSGGTITSTTIYARFNRPTAGTSSGNITHASTGAITQNVAVSGTATIAACTPYTENFNSLTVGTRIGQVAGWTESGSASPAVATAGLASTQGIATGSSIFNWSAHPFLWSNADLQTVTFQMDFQANSSGVFDDDRVGWMTQDTPANSEYVFGVQLDPAVDGTATCATGQNIETYWRNPAFSTSTRIETPIACLPALTANGWYRAKLVVTKLTNASAKLDVTLTALDASGNPGTMVASGIVPNTSTWAGGAAPAEYFNPSGTSTGLYPSYKNHSGTTGNADNAAVDFCSASATQYSLTTNVTGSGSITLNPSGGVYDPGTIVQITAVPGSGATFTGWSGNLTGSTNPASITMDANKTVTAAFATSSATVTFQEGVSSYAGTVDTTLKYNTPSTSYGSQAYFEWDTQETAGSNTPEVALLQFSNIFGSNVGQIPLGSTITSATLQYRVYSGANSMGNSANVYEPLVTWNEATTYNTFGGEAGVQTDEYNSTLVGTATATTASANYTVDVTASLQRWASGTSNYGWVFLSSGTDGVEVHSSETTTATERPLLTVTYSTTPPTPPTAPTAMAATTPQPAQIHLAWTDTSNNETGFELERSTTGIDGTYSLLATLVSNTVAHDDSGLTGGQEYCYRVRAVNGAGQSSYAGPACATPTAPEALDFGSGTAHVTFGDPAALDLAQFTIETWFKRTGTGTTNTTGSGGIVSAIPLVTHGSSQADGSNVDANWLLVIDDATDVIGADFEDMATGLNHPVLGTTTISNNVWYHAAATYDGTTWRLYLNGRLEATLAANAAPRSDTIQQAGLGVMIESGGATHGHFQGVLDETRVWNYARTQAEIRSSINSQITAAQTGLVARWALDDGSLAVASSAGTTVNGTISGSGYSWVAPGAPNNLSFNEAPSQPVLVQPANNGTGVGTSPTLTVAVSDPESEPMDVTFYGRPAGGSTGENFTVIVLPDTQNYSSTYPATFTTQTQWIVNNRDDLNIVYVVHEGDIVNDANVATQWTNADAAMDLLDAANIPYGVVPGNHDDADGGTNYNNYFGVSRFAGKTFYKGEYPTGDNQNNYTFFSASGMDFVVINLDYTNPASGSLNWADNLLKTNSTRRGIVVSHDIILTGNPANFSTWGQSIYNALNDNPNLFLMLNGHTHGEGQRKDGNIQSLLADYQNYTNGGNGYLRIMEFSPATDTISVKTYSPTLSAYETDSNSQFTLTYDMDAGVPFTNLGTVSDVPSGNNASIPWSGLVNNTQYEWYALVSDGAAQTTGATWNFTTMSANTAPVANDQTVNVTEDTAQGIVLTGSDAENDPLTFTVQTQPAHGSLSGTAPTLTYSPDANYNGPDSFTFKINDGTADSNTAAVTINVTPVNDAPVCSDVALTTNEDVTGQTAPSCTDVENAALTYSVVLQPGTGSASLAGSQLVYVPSANFNGSTVFTYQASDGSVDSNIASVSVAVHAVNDAPVAENDTYSVAQNGALNVPAPGVLVNDMDIEANLLTAVKLSDPSSGTLTFNADGSFVYTPAANFHGAVSFTYQANDGASDSASATVGITVVPNEYTLTITSPHGTVTQSPAQATYHYGDTVQLTAVPQPGWNFTSWSGAAGGTTNPISITIQGDTAVAANYSQIGYTLNVPIVGNGSVTKDPDQAVYHYGETVQLTAVPEAGWQFSAWSGDATGSTSPMTITIDGNKSVIATFTDTTQVCTGILYVDKNSTAPNPTGCSWSGAFRTLQDALAAAPANGTTIWVADGTYYPDEGAGQVNNARSSTFNLKSGVSIYGGFSGSETLFTQRNPALYVTTLSGDIGTVGVNTDNAFHVVYAASLLSTTRLDGFTISDGRSDDGNDFGGGVYIDQVFANLQLTDLTISNNYAGNGGGVAAFVSNPILTRVIFSNNTSARYGGGFYNADGSPVLTDVVFNGNRTLETASPGGGMHSTNSDAAIYTVVPILTNVTFMNNQAVIGGGGGLFNNQSHAVLTNVTFSGNSAGRRGGAILNEGSNTVLNNVTFSGNTAPAGMGGAIINIYANGVVPSNPVIRNTILWGNGTEEIVTEAGSSVTIYNSVVRGGCPALGTCTNVVNADPKLGVLANNGGFTQTMALGANSSAIDVGNAATCATVDQRGVARPQGIACDAGAYEAGVQTTLTVSPVTGEYNGVVTLTAVLNYNGSGLAGKSITFTLNGTNVGSATTNASGIATLNNISLAGLNMGIYPSGITASFAGEPAYPSSNAAADLTIGKATPVITWANPADIVQGTALSTAQLNAAASVAGTFVYNPPAGTVLDAGNGQTLSVDFTPQDTVNYNNASASVTINVYTCHSLTIEHTGQGTDPAVDPVQSSGCPAGNYRAGETIQLSGAAPDIGWHIAGWVGTVNNSSTAATNSLTMPASDHTVSVTYVQDEYTLNVISEHGTVTKVPDQPTYHYMDEVTLNAVPQTGWIFTGWTPALTDNKVTITGNTTVTANYAPQTFTLTYSAGTGGTLSGDTTQTVNYGANGSAITAVANTGYHFVSWSDGILTATRTDSNITANLSVTATFAINTYTLTYTAGTGGTLTGNAAQTVNHGENGTAVTAVANTGYHFVSWSDGVLTATRTDTNITADLSLTANFAIDTFTLTYTAGANGTLSGNASQTVNSGADGTPVTAVANSGYHFVNWSDGLTTNPRTDTNVTANVSVTAQFAPDTVTHSITLHSGWNLVSFNVHPTDTAVSAVLASIAGNYDLIYAWDASGAHTSSGNWLKADNIPYAPDTLTALDETMGFWIHMTAADTLEVQGTVPSSTEIQLLTGGGGWNLVSYPSSVNRALPGAFHDFGVVGDFSSIYAYHANETADPWKLFDPGAPAFANDLDELTPGWGYWVKVSANKTWTVNYTAP